ncbi:glycosyltransferase family 39 protein [Aquimarina sp. 2201CG14-23]|uniref:glycosyltransferase family 39 protein n=1 Tax=Aquimarina mycalae TaxID=3040073 RepID=UPI0024780CD3|nr:glycosyltransferase family 39 protein [Aquimarina sp. 2201CG14-23]MDH7448053.1 hypothetical protein [Aquimarina sp. 2201CG14-23]
MAKIIAFGEMNSNRLWNKGDAIFYHFMATSLLEDGDLDLSNNNEIVSLNDGHFALSKFGYPTAKQSPLMTIVSLPFRFVFGPVGSLWFNILCSLGIVLILYELLLLWVSDISALIASLLIGLGSVLFRYAFNFSPDVFSCFLVLALLISLLKERWILVGLLAGLAISAKIGNVIVVVPILSFVLFRLPLKNIKTYLLIGVSFVFAVLPFMIYNNYMFGSPFNTGYHSILTVNNQGTRMVLSHTNDFNLPFMKGLISLLFNTRNGLVIDNVFVVFLAVIGLFFIPKNNRKELFLIFILICIQVIFYSLYDHQLASRLGNRFLLLSIALMAVPISFFIEKIKNNFSAKYYKEK